MRTSRQVLGVRRNRSDAAKPKCRVIAGVGRVDCVFDDVALVERQPRNRLEHDLSVDVLYDGAAKVQFHGGLCRRDAGEHNANSRAA
jgi:hypothetical protein